MTPKRKRMGRPPRTDSPERLAVYVPEDLKRQLEHRAEDERRTLTAVVCAALEAYLARRPAK